MIKVTDWGGEELSFDETKTTDWISRNFKISRSVARDVARRLANNFGDRTVEMRELFVTAAQLSVQAVAKSGASLNLSRGGPLPIFAVLDPVAAAAKAAELLAGQIAKGDWVDEGPEGLKREFGSFLLGGDDANAPSVISATKVGLDCCPAGGPKGVKLKINVRVTDDAPLSPGNDSGVRTVRVQPVHPRLKDIRTDDGAVETTLSDADNEKSQDFPVDVQVVICIPCSFIAKNIAVVAIRLIDDDKNERFVLRAFDVSDKFKDCCGAT